MNTNRDYYGEACPATAKERLQRAVNRHGHVRVIAAVGLSQAAFWRVLAGAPIRSGTYHQLLAGLDALEGE